MCDAYHEEKKGKITEPEKQNSDPLYAVYG